MIFSYSILNDARKCQKYFEYKHLKQVSVQGPLDGDLEFGTGIHLGVQNILEDGGDGISDFEIFWNSLANQKVEWGRFSYENYYDQAKTLFRKFQRGHARKFRVSRMEQRLGITFPQGFRFEGTPDFVGEYEGVPSLIDFKTSAYNYAPEKILSEEQLSLYKELEERVNGFKAKQKIYVVFKKDYADPSIQTPLIAPFKNTGQAWKNMVSECTEITQRQVFHKNPGACMQYNKKCPFFDLCWN